MILKEHCLYEFEKEKSAEFIKRFNDVFLFFKSNAIDENSLIRKLHLGYTAMRPNAFDFAAEQFPWLEQFRIHMGLDKKLNFLETNGKDKKTFDIHIDGKNGKPSIMFNSPVMNCTKDTKTFWVEPLIDFESQLKCEHGAKTETKYGATPHLPHGTPYRIVHEHHFIDQCAFFRSDVYHGVINNSNSDDFRILMHWWFQEQYQWDEQTIKTLAAKFYEFSF